MAIPKVSGDAGYSTEETYTPPEDADDLKEGEDETRPAPKQQKTTLQISFSLWDGYENEEIRFIIEVTQEFFFENAVPANIDRLPTGLAVCKSKLEE